MARRKNSAELFDILSRMAQDPKRASESKGNPPSSWFQLGGKSASIDRLLGEFPPGKPPRAAEENADENAGVPAGEAVVSDGAPEASPEMPARFRAGADPEAAEAPRRPSRSFLSILAPWRRQSRLPAEEAEPAVSEGRGRISDPELLAGTVPFRPPFRLPAAAETLETTARAKVPVEDASAAPDEPESVLVEAPRPPEPARNEKTAIAGPISAAAASPGAGAGEPGVAGSSSSGSPSTEQEISRGKRRRRKGRKGEAQKAGAAAPGHPMLIQALEARYPYLPEEPAKPIEAPRASPASAATAGPAVAEPEAAAKPPEEPAAKAPSRTAAKAAPAEPPRVEEPAAAAPVPAPLPEEPVAQAPQKELQEGPQEEPAPDPSPDARRALWVPRFFEGIVGDEIVKNFRKPLEVRLGTLLVALIVFGAAVTVAAVYIHNEYFGDGKSLARGPESEGFLPGAAAAPGGGGPGESGSPVIPASGQRIEIPELIPPAPGALPEIRRIEAAAPPMEKPKPAPQPAPPAPPGAKPETGAAPAAQGNWYIQVQSLLFENHFDALAEYVAELGFAGVRKFTMKYPVDNQPVYILRLGPYAAREDAAADLDRFKQLNRERPFTKFPKFKLQLAFPIELSPGKD